MSRINYADLCARIAMLNQAGADLKISRRNGYTAIDNQAESYTYHTGTNREIDNWLAGFAAAWYYKTDRRG